MFEDTAAVGTFALTAYCASTKPMVPISLLTLSTMSELRSGTSTGHFGEAVTAICARNLELTLERKSENT
jgi:hypothetical protein